MPATFQAYVQEAAAVGLSLSITKCRIWDPPGVAPPGDLLPEIARVRGCIRVLGVPIDETAEVEAALEEDLLEWSRGLEELPALGDAHVAISLFRQCASARLWFLQRALAPTPGVLGIYQRFDGSLCGVVVELLGDAAATSAAAAASPWPGQAALPIKWGGLGLGDLALTAPAANLGCWTQITLLLANRILSATALLLPLPFLPLTPPSCLFSFLCTPPLLFSPLLF